MSVLRVSPGDQGYRTVLVSMADLLQRPTIDELSVDVDDETGRRLQVKLETPAPSTKVARSLTDDEKKRALSAVREEVAVSAKRMYFDLGFVAPEIMEQKIAEKLLRFAVSVLSSVKVND